MGCGAHVHGCSATEDSLWKCAFCEEPNHSYRTKCNNCGEAMLRTTKGVSQDAWTCPTCDEINHGNRTKCNNCGLIWPPPGNDLAATGNTSSALDLNSDELQNNLPAGWNAYTDEKSGEVYYFNTASHVTQWFHPSITQGSVLFAKTQCELIDHIDTANVVSVGFIATGTRMICGGEPFRDLMGFRFVPILPHGCVRLAAVEAAKGSNITMDPKDFSVQSSAGTQKYLSLCSIAWALWRKDTILLKGLWLRRAGSKHPILPRRQELGLAAFWDPMHLMPLAQERKVQISAISYCWLTDKHPDPEGKQLKVVRKVLGYRLDEKTLPLDDMAVFWDWGSLFQQPRTDEQNVQFKRGLNHVNLWYAHRDTLVLLLTAPERFLAGVRSFWKRGWPMFERAVSSMIADSANLLDLRCCDDSCHDWYTTSNACKIGRSPPRTPEAFASELQDLIFTNDADSLLVIRKYTETFDDVLALSTRLDFTDSQWTDLDIKHLADVLPHCRRLKTLRISLNVFGPSGANMLAIALPQCKSLVVFTAYGCSFGDEGAEAFAEVIPQCLHLQQIEFGDCSLSSRGVIALASRLPQCNELTRIGLDDNQVCKDGVEAVIAALGQDCTLEELSMRNAVTNVELIDEIKSAWQKARKRDEALFL